MPRVLPLPRSRPPGERHQQLGAVVFSSLRQQLHTGGFPVFNLPDAVGIILAFPIFFSCNDFFNRATPFCPLRLAIVPCNMPPPLIFFFFPRYLAQPRSNLRNATFSAQSSIHSLVVPGSARFTMETGCLQGGSAFVRRMGTPHSPQCELIDHNTVSFILGQVFPPQGVKKPPSLK